MSPAGSHAPEEVSPNPGIEALRECGSHALESLTHGFAILDAAWRLRYANAAAAALAGMKPEEMPGRDYRELLPEASRTQVHAELLRGVRELVPVEAETYDPAHDRWLLVRAYPAPGGGPSVFFEDVTARKRAEKQLRQSERRFRKTIATLRENRDRFRAIVETTPECVKLMARDGTLLHINSPGLALVGAASVADVVGRCFYDLVAPEFRDEFRRFNEAVCGGNAGSLDFDVVGLNGVRRQLESRAAPVRNPDGSTVHLAITRDVTDRRRAERSSMLLAAIVDSSDDVIISKNLDGIITSWNKSAQRLFGYTAEEVIGKSITILIPPDRLAEEPEILRRLQRGERVDHFETVRRRKDGSLLHLSLTISPVRDAQGKVIGASKIARDITERKAAEEAIQRLNWQLTSDLSAMTRMQSLSTRLVQAQDFPVLLAEIVDAGIEITHADMGHIQLLEDGVLKIAAHRGFDDSFLGFFANIPHTADARPERRAIFEDVADSPVFAGTPALDVLLAAGVRGMQVTPLISRSGKMLGLFSTHYRSPRCPGERELRMLDLLARQAADLIERKLAEAALSASERRFRQLAESMPQIVWTARPDGYVDYWNNRWYEFSGFDRQWFGDAGWEPILHADDFERSHDAWHESVRTGEPFQVEYRFWDRREKHWRWFMGRALPVRNEDGSIVKWFGSCTDIDDQKRVEDELRRVNQDLEQFAYSASHDLQEPLRGVKVYTELLSTRYGGKLDGEALEFLGYIRGGATRMELLVRDLLAYTQVTRLGPANEETDANETLADTLANLKSSIAESGARVTAGPLPRLSVHALHLKQLFQNLIGNAIKYRSAQRAPKVHVSAKEQNGYWIFSVRDNGIGIEPEYREHVFGLFKRLHTGDEYSGTGIGLAICQRIVERYHGRIWVESEPGEGSQFFFTLPV
jgi:PAS domain S-box-containing protein